MNKENLGQFQCKRKYMEVYYCNICQRYLRFFEGISKNLEGILIY
jgi:hypothetical protein